MLNLVCMGFSMNTENKSFTPAEIKNLWQTPKGLFDSLDMEFCFTGDVAANHDNALSENFYTESDDALKQRWFKVSWCNPPYDNISPWVAKAIDQHKKGKTVVMLVPSDTSVKWFKEAFDSCNEVRFISGRLSFINASTKKPVNGNNKGSVLFIWRAYCKSKSVSLVDRNELLGITL